MHSKCQCLLLDLLLIDRHQPGKELLLQANWLQSRQRMLSEKDRHEFVQFGAEEYYKTTYNDTD